MIYVSFDDVSAAMLPCARPFRPYRNVFLTWARPRLLYSPGGRPSRIGQPLAVEGSEGGCYIHPQPLAEEGKEEVPEKEEGEEEFPEEEEGKEEFPEEEEGEEGSSEGRVT